MITNSYGFPTASSFEGATITQQAGLSVGAAVQLPDTAEARLRELLAFRLLHNGHFRQALSDARGGLQSFQHKIREHYGKDWDAIKDSEGFAGSRGHSALAGELATIQRDLAHLMRAGMVIDRLLLLNKLLFLPRGSPSAG